MITASKPVISSRSRTREHILTYAVAVSAKDAGDLFAALRTVPDPRPGGARRHPTAYVLGVRLGRSARRDLERVHVDLDGKRGG